MNKITNSSLPNVERSKKKRKGFTNRKNKTKDGLHKKRKTSKCGS